MSLLCGGHQRALAGWGHDVPGRAFLQRPGVPPVNTYVAAMAYCTVQTHSVSQPRPYIIARTTPNTKAVSPTEPLSLHLSQTQLWLVAVRVASGARSAFREVRSRVSSPVP